MGTINHPVTELASDKIMADDFITLDKQTYASLQEEIITLRQQVASFHTKEYLLNGVIQASNYLLMMDDDDFEQSIHGALAVLGMAINTEYISIWECHFHPSTEKPVISQRWHWGNLEQNHNQLQNIHQDGFTGWEKIACKGNYITEPTENLPELLGLPLQSHGIETLLIIPMTIEGNLWGIITLGEPQNNQQWSDTQRYILHKAGLNFAGAIAQNQVKVKLQESQTERKQVEVELRQLNEELERRVEERTNQLRQQEIQYRSIFEAVSDGLSIIDVETGILIEANPAACAIHGYTYREFIGKHSSLYVHPDYHYLLEEFTSTIKAGDNFHCQAVDVCKDGSLLDVEVMGTSFLYYGRTHGLIIIRDITERKQAELLLHNRTKRLRSQNSVLSSLTKSRIVNQGDLQLVAREITSATACSLKAERVSVWLYDKDKTCLQCFNLYEAHSGQHSQGSELLATDYSAYFQALETEDIIAADDVTTDSRTREFSSGYLAPLNITSMLDSPIRFGGETIGVLCIEKTDLSWQWYPEDESFARSIADVFTLAIEARDRQRVEDALRQKEAQYRSIFEAVNDGIFIHDLDTGNIVAVNPAGCRIFGYSYKELLNIHPIALIHPDYYQVFANLIDTIRSGHKFNAEAVDVRKDGTLFNIEASGSLCMYQGRHHGLVVIRDISDRKQAEIQLKQQAEDLENALYELQCTQSQLIQSEKLSSLGEMVAGVAHEVNNPINFIHGNLIPATQYTQDLLGLLELYQQHYPNPPQEIEEEIEAMDLEFLKIDIIKLLSSMRVGTQRIREIVLSLRNFSRLDEAEFKQVDIHEGLDSTLMILHNRLKATPERPEIAIVKDYASLPPIECYPGQLNQVFMNILANAIDALEEYNQKRTDNDIIVNPSCIRIYTDIITDNLVAIRISDNGAGIPPEVQKKLFDPFFTTKDVGKGTGLGLSISYQIVVEKHGGKLSCQSTLGKGTEFAIEIPIIQG